jgi:hypothetical protein
LVGIAQQTRSQLLGLKSDFEISEYNLQNLEELVHNIKTSQEKSILIAAGTYGIEAIKLLKSNKDISDKVLAIHVFHQMIDSKENGQFAVLKTGNQDGADIIALPSHVLNENLLKRFESSKTKLIQTIGVAHKTTKEDIKKSYDEHKNILPESSKYLGIILPGDAPDSAGRIKYFTTEDATKLVGNIFKKFPDYFLLISNGPRTGKHDTKTGEISRNHIDNIMDPVTKQFITILDQNKIKYKLFDFQRGTSSYKNLIFGTISHSKDNIMLIPGESTSLISEAVDLIPSDQVVIYSNVAMNDNHKKHIMSEFEAGRASIMDIEGNIGPMQRQGQKSLPAKALIAQGIIKHLNQNEENY